MILIGLSYVLELFENVCLRSFIKISSKLAKLKLLPSPFLQSESVHSFLHSYKTLDLPPLTTPLECLEKYLLGIQFGRLVDLYSNFLNSSSIPPYSLSGIAVIALCFLLFLFLLVLHAFLKKIPSLTGLKTTTHSINNASSLNIDPNTTHTQYRHPKHHISRALSSVIIPTPSGKSRFPASFLRVAGAARVSRVAACDMNDADKVSGIVEIEAAILLAGLVSGKLELRDRWMEEEGIVGTKGSDFDHSRSKDSLDELISFMKGSLGVGGYQFKLNVGKKMWASVASWVVLAGYGGTTTAPKTKGVDFSQCTRYVQIASFGRYAPIIRSIQPLHPESTMKLDLDFVPYASFESTVKAFIHSIPLSKNQNIDAILEFTVLAPHVKWLSREYVLCAIPFMYTNDGRNANSIIKSDATPPPTLTPTPMLLSLKQVIENLTSLSSSSSLQILSCTNTSSECSSSLREIVRERDLVGLDGGLNPKGHAHGGCGEESSSWMRERSMMLWQAAILRAGWVQRWVVVSYASVRCKRLRYPNAYFPVILRIFHDPSLVDVICHKNERHFSLAMIYSCFSITWACYVLQLGCGGYSDEEMLVVTNKRRTRGFQMRMASNRFQQFGIRQNAIGPSEFWPAAGYSALRKVFIAVYLSNIFLGRDSKGLSSRAPGLSGFEKLLMKSFLGQKYIGQIEKSRASKELRKALYQ
ncbi:hypothetical protein EV359DRAFT_65939 [Lentinula novae-zelandiae]|nr:hypothetical protein EV359DRAFT_65939 [Lentinula novae-zelandiae]